MLDAQRLLPAPSQQRLINRKVTLCSMGTGIAWLILQFLYELATNWTVRDSNTDRAFDLSLLQNVQTDYCDHTVFFSMGTGVLSRG